MVILCKKIKCCKCNFKTFWYPCDAVTRVKTLMLSFLMNIVIETFFAGSKEHFSSFLYELGVISFFDNIFAYAYER